MALDQLGDGRTVLYIYPMTGQPGVDLPDGWNEIPGARGCTPEACGFRDHYAELRTGRRRRRSTGCRPRRRRTRQSSPSAWRSRSRSSPTAATSLRDALDLPTFTADGELLYKRLTLIVSGGRIEHVFYPIFPPDGHAAHVLEWLSAHSAR